MISRACGNLHIDLKDAYLQVPVNHMPLVTVFYRCDDLPEFFAGFKFGHPTMLSNVI